MPGGAVAAATTRRKASFTPASPSLGPIIPNDRVMKVARFTGRRVRRRVMCKLSAATSINSGGHRDTEQRPTAPARRFFFRGQIEDGSLRKLSAFSSPSFLPVHLAWGFCPDCHEIQTEELVLFKSPLLQVVLSEGHLPEE